MKILLLAFSTFLAYNTKSHAQQHDLSQNYIVISTNGLNLRMDPGTNSEVLLSIPYGEKVRIIEQDEKYLDTIGGHTFYSSGSKTHFSHLTGYWVKINYKGIEGFVFDAYLYVDITDLMDNLDPNINKDFVLLFPGNSCNYNFWFNNKLKWYGIYKLKETVHLKQISLSYYKDYSSELGDVGISTNDNKNLCFIIGSKYSLINESKSGEYSYEWYMNNFDKFPEFYFEENSYGKALILELGKRNQILNPKNEDYLMSPSNIIWKGDLDGDNHPDYIIHFGSKQGRTVLYLSSEAVNNQIVKPVAIFYSGYCC